MPLVKARMKRKNKWEQEEQSKKTGKGTDDKGRKSKGGKNRWEKKISRMSKMTGKVAKWNLESKQRKAWKWGEKIKVRVPGSQSPVMRREVAAAGRAPFRARSQRPASCPVRGMSLRGHEGRLGGEGRKHASLHHQWNAEPRLTQFTYNAMVFLLLVSRPWKCPYKYVFFKSS